MKNNKKDIEKIRNKAPRPFGLYTATCMGLDGGYTSYLKNFNNSHFVDFCNGIKKYRYTEYIPKRCDYEIINKKGRVKLLEFAKSGKPILLVPSMINKYYIFDLYEDNSFILYLIKNGFRPYVIDWDSPTGNKEEQIDLRSSVEDYILYFSKYLNKQLKEQVHLLGYCMGGTLSLAAALKDQKLFKSLNLIATPVDFNEMPFAGMTKFYEKFYLQYLQNNNVSVEVIQTLFYMQDCKGVIERIKSFDKIKDKKQLKRMVSLEDWLSDCVELENVMAKDCISLWYCQNKIYPEELDFRLLNIPCNIITASKDTIVPNKSSLFLLEKIKHVNHISVDSGHIGIMVGRKSILQFYNKIVNIIYY